MVISNGAAQLLTLGGLFLFIALGIATKLLLPRRAVPLRAHAVLISVGTSIALSLLMLGLGWPLHFSTLMVAVALWALFMAISVMWLRAYDKYRRSSPTSDASSQR